MNSPDSKSNPVRFVPLSTDLGAALPVCVVVVAKGDHSIVPVLRTTNLATAFLGAVCDAQGKAFDWVELWFPHEFQRGGDSNSGSSMDLDAIKRWRDLVERWEHANSSGFIKLGWESGLPHPLVLQPDTLSWVKFVDPETGQMLHFCRDDDKLLAAGLAPHSSTTAAFLTGDGRTFVQACGAIGDKSTLQLEALLPKNKSLIKISMTGRGMAVRRIASLALGDYADLVAGLTLDIERQELVRLGLNVIIDSPVPKFLTSAHRALLRARAGRKEWMAEIVALKMRAVCQAIKLVRDGIAVTGEPFLSLSEHAFAVRFGRAGPPLELWDFELVFHGTGCAAIRQGAGAKFAWRAHHESQMPAAYERRSNGRQVEREVECRLRLVTRQDKKLLVEATLGRCEETNVGGMIGCVHLPLASGRHVLWGRLSRDNSLSRDEIRFRSFPAEIGETVAAELERMQGFVWSNVLLEVLPAAGYGDDFHSLGVLATRLLLTSESRQLPSSLDAIFSIIESLREAPPAASMAIQLRAAFDREPRFRELLHPGRAAAFPISGDDAVASLGDGTWWELLAFIVRLFPTEVPTAFCHSEQVADLGIFPRAFDDAVGVAEALSRRLTDQVMPHESVNARVRAITASLRRASP